MRSPLLHPVCSTFLVVTLLLIGATVSSSKEPATKTIAPDAKQVHPLDVGSAVPDVAVRTSSGDDVTLKAALHGKPTALVFYRGGWCPICSRHTAELIKVQPQLKAAGVQMVAISPDAPENATQTISKLNVPYPVLSDSDLTATRAFGLAFQVDDQTLEKYRGYGIDLEQASGRDHHALPVPAVYLIDAGGKIVYRHYDPDYRQRLSGEELLKAVKEHLAGAK